MLFYLQQTLVLLTLSALASVVLSGAPLAPGYHYVRTRNINFKLSDVKQGRMLSNSKALFPTNSFLILLSFQHYPKYTYSYGVDDKLTGLYCSNLFLLLAVAFPFLQNICLRSSLGFRIRDTKLYTYVDMHRIPMYVTLNLVTNHTLIAFRLEFG